MRVRITLTVSVLVALALGSAGLIAYGIQRDRVHEQVLREIDQELAEFAKLEEGLDPETGRRFADVEPLARTFLSRNVPDDDELLVGWWDGAPRIASPRADPLTGDPEFVRFLEGRIATGGSTLYSSPTYGELMVTVQPVSGRGEGALVVVTFLDRTREALYDTIRTYAIVATGLWILVTALAAWQSGRLLAPLRELRETSREITATDLSRRIPERGNDDITALTRTLNDMFDRLEGGFELQRRFLDDAGHELKTPLTVLRGHLELLDTGDPQEVSDTRDLLLDETDRMSRLVGDLILLAKSRRPDFVRRQPVEVRDLLHAVLAKASALGEREWRLAEPPERVVDLDEQRITQALLQLADNAVRHTGPGDVIELGASASSPLVLWVADSGPGVPVEDRQAIFERFGRGSTPIANKPVGNQPVANGGVGEDGFGLGLSIVRAIAEAHDGTARVVEDPDIGGARFEIIIPEEESWPAS